MHVSVVIPLLNEDESLPELHQWIRKVAEREKLSYEIIFVDDGSTDNSWEVIEKLAKTNEHVKAIRFRRNHGKSAALNAGFAEAKGDVVITMDADLQDSPEEIPGLFSMIQHEGFDLVSGWKKKRHDPFSKTAPSKFFNSVTRWMSGIPLHDFNCGLKAYKNEVVKEIEVYGEMHRYIPVLARRAGYRKIGERVVQHQARKYGTTKFGLERFINGFLDLMSIMFMTKFGKRPMHLFGTLGVITFFIGFVILLYLSITKIIYSQYGMTDRPLFYFGLITLVIGVQLFLSGFVAELITGNSPHRNDYFISSRIRIN